MIKLISESDTSPDFREKEKRINYKNKNEIQVNVAVSGLQYDRLTLWSEVGDDGDGLSGVFESSCCLFVCSTA